MEEKKKVEKRTRSYVEEAFRQIKNQPDVKDILILNLNGNPVKTTMTENSSVQHAGMYGSLLEKSKYILNLIEPKDEVVSLRVRTKFHETLLTPDHNITFIVIQEPTDRMHI